MMKRIGFICVALIFTAQLYSQEGNSLNRLQKIHDSIYDKYRSHADTLTLNSWFNIMQTNRYLSILQYYDSLIKDHYVSVSQPDSSGMIFTRELLELQNESKYLKSNFENARAKAQFYQKMYWMLIALALVFLVIILALAMVAGRTGKRLNQKDQSNKKQYTELHAAKIQIENSRKTENQMASEINRLKKLIGQSDAVSLVDFQALQDEKLMLENQILEIKKAFELESQKRMEAEALRIDEISTSEKENDTHAINELRNSLSTIGEENENLKQQLFELKSDNLSLSEKVAELEQLHERYQQLLGQRSALADDLQNMIDKLKNK